MDWCFEQCNINFALQTALDIEFSYHFTLPRCPNGPMRVL